MKKEKNIRKQKRIKFNLNSTGCITIVGEKGIWVGILKRESTAITPKNQKVEKAIDGDEDDVLLCLLMMKNKKVSVKKKVLLV